MHDQVRRGIGYPRISTKMLCLFVDRNVNCSFKVFHNKNVFFVEIVEIVDLQPGLIFLISVSTAFFSSSSSEREDSSFSTLCMTVE